MRNERMELIAKENKNVIAILLTLMFLHKVQHLAMVTS
jgi:hypothetical protein